MDYGFIYLHRKITENWIWQNPLYFHWFCYLLFRANFQKKDVLIGAKLYKLERGEFITSLNNLEKDLPNSSPQKIRTFLHLLEKDSIIIKKSTSTLTQITICKYEDYQGVQQTNNKPATNAQQTNNKRVTTEKKDNKEKKVNNNKNDFDFSFFSENEIPLVHSWIDHRKSIKKPISQAALSLIKKDIDIKGLPMVIKQIEAAIKSGWQGYDFPIKENNLFSQVQKPKLNQVFENVTDVNTLPELDKHLIYKQIDKFKFSVKNKFV